jgi:hypothetical protein
MANPFLASVLPWMMKLPLIATENAVTKFLHICQLVGDPWENARATALLTHVRVVSDSASDTTLTLKGIFAF